MCDSSTVTINRVAALAFAFLCFVGGVGLGLVMPTKAPLSRPEQLCLRRLTGDTFSLVLVAACPKGYSRVTEVATEDGLTFAPKP